MEADGWTDGRREKVLHEMMTPTTLRDTHRERDYNSSILHAAETTTSLVSERDRSSWADPSLADLILTRSTPATFAQVYTYNMRGCAIEKKSQCAAASIEQKRVQ